MNKYIDADKLLSGIREEIYKEGDGDAYEDGYDAACLRIMHIIRSLQQEQPEVELENEYKTWWNSISGKINVEHMMEWYMHETARHFYELGARCQKEVQLEVDLKREAVMFCIDHGINISPRHAEMIARHFFEFKIEE